MPDGRRLEPAVIRGEASEGMLCSERELGLSDEAGGLMVLSESLTPGTPLPAALNLMDPVIEIELTPNRPDCLGILGIAREVAAIQGVPLTKPALSLTEDNRRIADLTSVTIQDPDHCARYGARFMDNVTVKPSPLWLRERLRSVGIRPINNIVDVTNFVMMETGQPLHAFDFDHLAGHKIVVRLAAEGEIFTTLDGKERSLAGHMLMICDGEKPVGVAGVMGGLNSEIQDTTTRVLLESAWFEPTSVRRTAKKLGLSTDASYRFERGVDPDVTLYAMNRATQLMAELSGATIVAGEIDERPRIVGPKPISVKVDAVNRLLGLELDAAAMTGLLESLEFTVVPQSAESLTVTPPSFRVDVSRPEDIAEEVARRWGYQRIPTTFPPVTVAPPAASSRISRRQSIRDLMAGFGFTEAITYSFIDRGAVDRLGIRPDDDRRRVLDILNPISEELAVMRTDLLPGLLDTVRRNISRQNRNLRLFEVGKTFRSNGPDQLPEERELLAAVWTGTRDALHWESRETPCDFYDIKGALEALLNGLGLSADYAALSDGLRDWSRAGRSASVTIQGAFVGIVAEVRPEVLDAWDIKQPVFAFSLDLESLAAFAPGPVQAAPLPRYPSTSRDLTLSVARDVEGARMLAHLRGAGEVLLEDAALVAVYEGEKAAAGRKNLSFRMTYRSGEGTLEDDTVTAVHQRLTDRLLSAFNAVWPG